MNRYIIFGGEYSFAQGGWHDFRGSRPDKNQAMEFATSLIGTDFVGRGVLGNDIEGRDKLNNEFQWAHVIDTQINEIVFELGDAY